SPTATRSRSGPRSNASSCAATKSISRATVSASSGSVTEIGRTDRPRTRTEASGDRTRSGNRGRPLPLPELEVVVVDQAVVLERAEIASADRNPRRAALVVGRVTGETVEAAGWISVVDRCAPRPDRHRAGRTAVVDRCLEQRI